MPEPTRILFTGDLRARGTESKARRAVRAGDLIRVRQGAYVDAAGWAQARPEERARVRARALAAVARREPVHGFLTAAAIHGLPIRGRGSDRVHVIESGDNPAKSRAGVVRHTGSLTDEDIDRVDGLLVTSLARTLFDVIRTASAEAAIAAFDAALRSVAWRGWGDFDDEAAEELRSAVARRIESSPGARGIRQARFITAFADGRAQLPGESVSRLWMHRLGAPEPELQREVRIVGGRAFPDFSWPALRKFGEFDGDGKYVDPALTQGRSITQVLKDQRSREGAVIAATGWSPVRWGNPELSSLATFEAFLRTQHLL